MKDVREREEDFKEMKRLRRLLGVKLDAAEKRVDKLGPDHKNLEQQTEILANLRKEAEETDSQILTEEAELGDFKRKAARDWMELKLGGLLDCSTKGTVRLFSPQLGNNLMVLHVDHRRTGKTPYRRTFYSRSHPVLYRLMDL